MQYPHERRERVRNARTQLVRFPLNCPDLDADMDHYLGMRNLSCDVARENSWYPTYDNETLEPRIVIPCSNSAGVPYWQARAMRDDIKLRYDSPSVPRDDSIVIVWPIDVTGKFSRAVIVEGPMDALAAAGQDAVGFALMGNAPNSEVLLYLQSKLRSLHPNKVLVIPDQDNPQLGSGIVSSIQDGSLRFSVRIPDEKDLAAMELNERKKIIWD